MMMDDEMSMWVRECEVRKETEAERTLRRVGTSLSARRCPRPMMVRPSFRSTILRNADFRKTEREKKANRKSIAGGRGKTVDYGGEEEDQGFHGQADRSDF